MLSRSHALALAVRLAILAPTSLVGACGTTTADVDERTVIVEIDGMVCDSCEQAITHELHKLDGVLESEVDHERGRAEVHVAAGKVTPEQVRAAISSLGYTARLADS